MQACYTIQNCFPMASPKEFSISIDGYYYLIIYGSHTNGSFCCIPNKGVGCELGDADDIFYNAEKLQRYFPAPVAQAISLSIQEVVNRDKITLPWWTVLKLSARAKNSLLRHRTTKGREIMTMEDLIDLSREEILRMRGAGPIARKEIAEALRDYGITDTDWSSFLPEEDR